MTLAEAEEIFAYWADNPPAHLMLQFIAAMLGWKRRPPDEAALTALAVAPPPGLAVAAGALGMPAPVLDPDVLRARNRARAVRQENALPGAGGCG